MATTTKGSGGLPEQIYRTADGYQVRVKLGGRLLAKRYPAGTPIATLETKRDEFRIALRRAAESVRTGATLDRGVLTLRDDVETYLEHLRARVAADDLHPTTLGERERYLNAWCGRFGDRPRAEIRTREIAEQLVAFEREGVVREAPLGAETVNKVRLALLRLYDYMNTHEELEDPHNPVSAVPLRTPPDVEPRGATYDVLEAILDKLPAGTPTKARLTLSAYTGMRPCEIHSIRAGDWNKRAGELYVRAGKGGQRRTIPLLPQAIAALEQLEKLDAWGYYWPAPVGRALKAAKVAAGYPDVKLRAYDMRHSFGSEVYRRTRDIKATKEALGHKTLRMSERYVEAAVSEMQQHVHDSLLKAIGGAASKRPRKGSRKSTRAGNTLVPVKGGRA